MMPAEVFQKESMTLTCKSESYASERLRREELTYTLDPPESLLTPKDTGVFFGTALPYDFNYTCIAQAKDIMKRSNTLTVHPKGEPTFLFQMQNVISRLTVDPSSTGSNFTCWPHIS